MEENEIGVPHPRAHFAKRVGVGNIK